MPAIPSHDTAVVDEPWDAGANVDNIKTPVTKAVAQDEWAWYDASSPDDDHDDGWPDAKSAYSFPHHQVNADGTPGAANKDACDNALARVGDADIPDADKAGVRAHVQHHLDAFNRAKAAARAEAVAAAVVDEPEPSDDQAPRFSVMTADPVSGYSDLDYARSSASHLELLLGKPWAIAPEAAIEVASRLALQAQGKFRSDEQLARMQAAISAPLQPVKAADGSEVAVIPLRGTITPRGSLFSLVFGGGGGLQMFRQQFRMAMADGNVSAIVLDIDSPGGVIDMVPETAAEILNARGNGKPIHAVANTTCASAAYWIAASADSVIATPSAQVGSIGVFVTHEDISRMVAAMGVEVSLVSAGKYKTEGNQFEPLSKAAQANLQSKVDGLYGIFTAQVAQGRGVSQAAVQAGYGQGRCLLANQALSAGLIDRIDTLENVVARLGGTARTPIDPAAQPGDLEDYDDGPDASTQSSPTSPVAGEHHSDVSAPPVDRLSPQRPIWRLS